MQIGRWLLDPDQHTLSDSAETRSLTPRSWDVLLHLIEHRGELVATETLLKLFWGGLSADRAYVRKSILEIRKALDDDARAPKLIKTVPKLGYVLLREDPEQAAGPVLAVLPFLGMGGDPDDDSFADGLTEELINELTQGLSAQVIARTSSFRFKNVHLDVRHIGRELNASHIVEGSVRRAANRVRITGQLIDCRSGTHLWSETFERELRDPFRVQDEVAGLITAAVRHVLKNGPGSASQPGHIVYVSRRFTAPDDFKRIVEAITRSIQEA
jgi:TolB-like protein